MCSSDLRNSRNILRLAVLSFAATSVVPKLLPLRCPARRLGREIVKIPLVQKTLGLWRPFPSFVFCGAIRFFLMAAATALGVLGLSRVAQADIRITSIAPACADLGDPVAITGNGFGALNVTIQVVSATGNRLTFLVPPGVPSSWSARGFLSRLLEGDPAQDSGLENIY